MTETAPYQSKQDQATQQRNQAINLYIKGEKPLEICRQLERSRTWFYKVLARYQAGGREALNTRSRAPHRVHNRTSPEVEATVVRVRKLIKSGDDPELRYANLGADALALEVERAGLQAPSRATINRILVRNNLAQLRPKGKRKQKLPDDYPWPKADQPNQVHLFDFVRRTIAGGERFYGCHLLDQARRWPYLDVIESKTVVAVSQFLLSAWQAIGFPIALYLDNDVVWRGSGSGKRTISSIVRLCLFFGIQVIFIPPYTPEANPIIESFNGLWDQNFWQRTEFQSLTHVQSELPLFVQYSRYRRPLASFGYKTADQIFPDFQPTLPPADLIPNLQAPLPITAGQIHFIRFVSRTGAFSFLNEEWQLDPEQWAGKTIRATVNTQRQQLDVFHQASVCVGPALIASFDYQLKQNVVSLQLAFERKNASLWPISECFDC